MKELIKSTRFVQRLFEKYKIDAKEEFLEYLVSLIKTTERRVERTDALSTRILAERLRTSRKLSNGYGTILGLKVLLGDLPETLYFPSRYYVSYIENTLGSSITFSYSPEIILPFNYTRTTSLRYNPKEYVIDSSNVYEEIVRLYEMEPKAVFIVSKFIEWKGFYRFISILKSLKKLPKTFIITSDPILPEVAEKYNLVRIPSKSHAKILMFVWDETRYCFLGSMNVLSPSRHNDFLVMYPGLEKYCVEFLIKSIV